MTRRAHTPAGRVVLWVALASWGAAAASTLGMPLVQRVQSAELRRASGPEAADPTAPDEERTEPARGIRPPWRDPVVPEMKRYKPMKQKSLTA